MFKKRYVFSVIIIVLLVAGITLIVKKNRDTTPEQISTKQESQKETLQPTSPLQLQTPEASQPAAEQVDAPVLLKTMANTAVSDGKQEGWFGDLLKDELNMEVQFVCYQDMNCEEYGEEFEKGIDVYTFFGGTSYYECVRKGKLKNLEKCIKKHPEVYSKYSKAIRYIKRDTYQHTGKIGVYGLPTWLESFEDNGKGKEGACHYVCVPADAEHPKEAMDLITYSASDEGILSIIYGPEGQMWKKKKENYVLLKDWYEMESKNPGKKFVKTKNGKEDFYSAVCNLELVANRSLADELIQ